MKITHRAKLLTTTVLLSALSTGVNAAKYVARVGHLESQLQPRHQMLEQFADKVSEKTNGEVEIKLYPSGQLGNQRQMTEGTQLGTLQGTVAPAAFLGGFNPAVSVLDIPFIYPADRELSSKIRQSEFGTALLESFSSKGVKAIALLPNGRKSLTSNKPIDTIEQFEGQRFRVMNSKVLIEQFRSLGSSAIALPFGELYTALQNGVVDGQENPLDTIQRMKYYEVQSHLVVSEHGAMEDVVLFNQFWWNSLPQEYRDVIITTFQELTPAMEANKEQAQLQALEVIKQNGVTVKMMSDKEKNEFRDVMYPKAKAAYVDFAGKDGQEILDIYEKVYADIVQ